jgi:hypothetical protein
MMLKNAMPTSLSPFIVIILPFIASIFTGILQHKELPHAKAFNATIAALFFIGTSLLCWAISGSISDNPQTNLLYYTAILAMIFNAAPCKAFQEALVEAVPSPLLLLKRRSKRERIVEQNAPNRL